MGRRAAKYGRRGARWASAKGEEMWDRVPRRQIRKAVASHVDAAHDTVQDFLEAELRDLRRALRRRRKALGI
jgi:hypothetical protein